MLRMNRDTRSTNVFGEKRASNNFAQILQQRDTGSIRSSKSPMIGSTWSQRANEDIPQSRVADNVYQQQSAIRNGTPFNPEGMKSPYEAPGRNNMQKMYVESA